MQLSAHSRPLPIEPVTKRSQGREPTDQAAGQWAWSVAWGSPGQRPPRRREVEDTRSSVESFRRRTLPGHRQRAPPAGRLRTNSVESLPLQSMTLMKMHAAVTDKEAKRNRWGSGDLWGVTCVKWVGAGRGMAGGTQRASRAA